MRFRRAIRDLKGIGPKIFVLLLLIALLLRQSLIVKAPTVRNGVDSLPEESVVAARTKKPRPSPQRPVLYSKLRPDRVGSVLHSMLLAHAFAMHENMEYGGVICGNVVFPEEARRILDAWGWSEFLPVWNESPDDPKRLIILEAPYSFSEDEVLTPEWLAFLREHTNLPSGTIERHRIVAHIRRGDVTLCSNDEDITKRYLPNLYYDSIIASIPDEQNLPVIVYSESKSFEQWSQDTTKELHLDAPDILAIWNNMATADHLILSKSSFSVVPALLNPNQVYYIPFWHRPLPQWKVASHELIQLVEEENKNLREKCP